MQEKLKILGIGEIFKFTWKYVKKYPFRLSFACIWLIISSLLEIVTPVVSGLLIDYLAANWANPELAFKWALYFIWIFLATWISFWVFRHTSSFLWSKIIAETLKNVVQDALYRIQRFSTQWHSNSFSWAIVTKVKRGMRWYHRFAELMFSNFIPLSLVIIWVVSVVIYKYSFLWIIIWIWTIFYAILSISLSLKYVMPAYREENMYDTLIWANLADTISCNSIVKSFWSENIEDKRMNNILTKFKKAFLVAWKRAELTNILQNTFMTLYKWTFLISAIYLWHIWKFTVWDVVYSLSSYHMISWYLRNIWSQIRQLQQAAWEMEDIVLFSKQWFLVEDKKHAKPLQVSKWEILIDNIDFKYDHQKIKTFNNFSLNIKPWESLAFVWHSWAWKSSFIGMLQRLYDIQKGSILIDWQNIKDVTLKSLRENIVLIPQEPILFHRSLYENISYWNQNATKKQIISAAKKAHAHKFITSLPLWYETLVWERWVKLSWWERQRIAIARAIVTNKKILLLDEATSSLDSISEKYIQDSMKSLMKNRTTIIIAHRLSTIRSADRIIVLNKWNIIEQWTHTQLLKTKWKYAKLWSHQADGFIM